MRCHYKALHTLSARLIPFALPLAGNDEYSQSSRERPPHKNTEVVPTTVMHDAFTEVLTER